MYTEAMAFVFGLFGCPATIGVMIYMLWGDDDA